MRSNFLSFWITLISVFIFGCKSSTNLHIDKTQTSIGKTSAVIIGMEKSKFAGNCTGAQIDSSRMYMLIKQYTDDVVLLQNEKATKSAVVNAMTKSVANSDLCIIFYSGHGGSEPFADTGIEEKDGKDEFLCLYDTWLKDNDIWKIISKSKGRILLMVDACHSETMWRSPGFKMLVPLSWDNKIEESNGFSMLCWSGCPDNTYSYGSSSGGQFTNALLRNFTKGMTYAQLWERIKSDKTLREFENPQSTAIGSGFEQIEFLK